MKFLKIILPLFAAVILFNSCASSYKTVQPHTMSYNSKSVGDDVLFEYRYDLLDKKYAKKEARNNVRLVAVRITNNSDKELTIGQDLKFAYDGGRKVYVMDNERAFKSLKQNSATYLFYLLLAPVNLYTTKVSGNEVKTQSYPIGLAIGPGLSIGNMVAAGSANKKLKGQLQALNVMGLKVAPGKTVSGLICIRSSSYNALELVSEYKEVEEDELINTKG